MKNPIKAVQSYAVLIIVGLFAFPKRLVVVIARFLKWLINSVRPRATPTTVDPVKSPEPINETTQPHAAPAKTSLFKIPKWLIKTIIGAAIFAAVGALFESPAFVGLSAIIGVSILVILGFSVIKIIILYIVGLLL